MLSTGPFFRGRKVAVAICGARKVTSPCSRNNERGVNPGTVSPLTFLGASTAGKTLTQAIVFNDTSCSYTLTARKTLQIAGTTFYADPVTFTLNFNTNGQLLSYVYRYPCDPRLNHSFSSHHSGLFPKLCD